MIIIANANLADTLREQGQLHQAARIYSESLQLAVRPDGYLLPLAGSIYAGLAKVAYEWNHLEDAGQNIQRCLAVCRQWENISLQAVCFVMLARLELAKGCPQNAQEAMRSAEQLASGQRLTIAQRTWLESCLARLWLAVGDLPRCRSLLQKIDLPSEPEIPYLQEPIDLLRLRLLLSEGDPDAALAQSNGLFQQAESAHRVGRVIEILLLQALAFQQKRELTQALAVLEKAILLAQPEEYVRVFLDEGKPMVILLHQAKAQQIGGEFVSELLAAIPPTADEMFITAGAPAPPSQILIEPLSARELEVLKLIEAGYSNQEIAEKLVISVKTVKRHISNIYGKLGAKSRTQAVVLGRELKLLG